MPRNGHVRCGGRARETGRAESRHRALVRSHTAQIHDAARGKPRAVNNLAIAALIATYATGKKIVDQSAARAAISEVISAE
jgi:type II secretory pathway predicted ATPase ExeA